MDSVAVTVPLRAPTKRMKKRKELDALAPAHAVCRRNSGKRSSQELLTDSSDDRSEYWNVTARSHLRKSRDRSGQNCRGLVRVCGLFLGGTIFLTSTVLVWLFIDVRQQLTALRSELDQVIAGNAGVPDALQKCHSQSKDLSQNQSVVFAQLSDLKLRLANISNEISGLEHDLRTVQAWLQASPELATVPKDVKSLTDSVASLGSEIRDLGATVDKLKENGVKAHESETEQIQRIDKIERTLLNITNNMTKSVTDGTQQNNETFSKADHKEVWAAIDQLSNNVTLLNETFTRKFNWTLEDQSKDHKLLGALQDKTENVSMTIMSLEDKCQSAKRDQDILQGSVDALTKRVDNNRQETAEIRSRLNQMQSLHAISNAAALGSKPDSSSPFTRPSIDIPSTISPTLVGGHMKRMVQEDN